MEELKDALRGFDRREDPKNCERCNAIIQFLKEKRTNSSTNTAYQTGITDMTNQMLEDFFNE